MQGWPLLLGLCFYLFDKTIENKGKLPILAETRGFISPADYADLCVEKRKTPRVGPTLNPSDCSE